MSSQPPSPATTTTPTRPQSAGTADQQQQQTKPTANSKLKLNKSNGDAQQLPAQPTRQQQQQQHRVFQHAASVDVNMNQIDGASGGSFQSHAASAGSRSSEVIQWVQQDGERIIADATNNFASNMRAAVEDLRQQVYEPIHQLESQYQSLLAEQLQKNEQMQQHIAQSRQRYQDLRRQAENALFSDSAGMMEAKDYL